MPALGEVLLDVLGGDLGDPETISPREAAEGLVEVYGSVSGAARAFGVARSTFRRWLAGSIPRHARDELVEFARDEWRAASDGTRGLDLGSLRVRGSFAYDGGGWMKGGEDRDIPLGQYLMPGAGAALVEAYRDGADAVELQAVLADHINDPSGWYRDTFDPDNPSGHWEIEAVSGI